MKNTFSLSQPETRKTRDIFENVKKAYSEGLVPIKTLKMEDIRKVYRYVIGLEDSKEFHNDILQWSMAYYRLQIFFLYYFIS